MSNQNNLEIIKDKLERGLITADEANVELVLSERVRVITGSMPRTTRNALNKAVKEGKLGRMKKDGFKPECYHHPTFKNLANSARSKAEMGTIRSLEAVLG